MHTTQQPKRLLGFKYITAECTATGQRVNTYKHSHQLNKKNTKVISEGRLAVIRHFAGRQAISKQYFNINSTATKPETYNSASTLNLSI